jgi:hypothetical protein
MKCKLLTDFFGSPGKFRLELPEDNIVQLRMVELGNGSNHPVVVIEDMKTTP